LAQDSSKADFWESRYRDNVIPWDAGKVPDSLCVYARTLPSHARILIPGCGSAYEAAFLAGEGFDMTALEPVHVSLLALDQQRRTEMPSNEVPEPERSNRTVIGVAAAAVLVIAGLVAIGLLNEDPPVTAPATTVVTTTDAPATTTTVGTSTTAQAVARDMEIHPAGQGPAATLTFSMPDGWSDIGWAVGSGAGFPQFISYWYVDNVFGDRCNSDGALLDPAAGPSVDDLAAAFVEAWGPYATVPEEATLGGYTGKHMVLTVPPASADCPTVNLNGWSESGAPGVASRTYPAPGLLEDIWILDVEGARQVVASAYLETTTAADLTEQQGILDSMHIEPGN
jgi:hypothetical protein